MKEREELARIAASLRPLPEHEAECTHQKHECNGCPLMGLSYSDQLSVKKEYLGKLFGREVELDAAPGAFAYRNKADLSYTGGRLGYRRKDDYSKSFRLSKCLLVSEKANETIRLVSGMLARSGTRSADPMRRVKGLGYVTVRENRKGDTMVNFTCFGENGESIESLCRELVASGVRSVNILVNRTWSDDARGEVVKSFGSAAIQEQILGKSFGIGPNTFFQTNVESAERIFRSAMDFVYRGASVMDLYCGVGALSIPAAGKCKNVLGIDISEESIASARANAKLNGASNAEFMAGNVDEVLKGLPHEFDTAIVDPPRAGLNAKTIRRLLRLEPERVIYVSCNPRTLAQNVKQVEGFEPVHLKAFDQFPHTTHVEMLCVLEKKA